MSPNVVSLLHYRVKEVAGNGDKDSIEAFMKSLLEVERISKANNNSETCSITPLLHRNKTHLSVVSQ